MQEVSGGNNGTPATAASTAAAASSVTDEDVVEVLSTPLEGRELHGTSRCMSCQEQDRKCYVDQKHAHCLHCRLPSDCRFRRTVERPMNLLDWMEITGTLAGQKRSLEDSGGGDASVTRKLRPIEDHHRRSSSGVYPNAADMGVNGGRQQPHEVASMSPGWYQSMDNNANNRHTPYTVHIKPLNLEPSDARMVRRIPVALPPPPQPPPPVVHPLPTPTKRPESQDRNGLPRPSDPNLYCDACQLHFSTNSEHSKHMSRHTKRFRCDVTGCKKIDGFATLNDLDRHKKSVHSAYNIQDPVWKCFVEGCKSREKIWPRQDNFKAHLERMHRGVDVEHYVKVSDHWLETEERPMRLARKEEGGRESQTQSQNQSQNNDSQSQQQQGKRSESRDGDVEMRSIPVSVPVPVPAVVVEGERDKEKEKGRRESTRHATAVAAANAAAGRERPLSTSS